MLYNILYMDAFCRKYNEPVSPVSKEATEKSAACKHPRDYCKFRSSCMVYFLSREDVDGRPEESEASSDGEPSSGRGDPYSL